MINPWLQNHKKVHDELGAQNVVSLECTHGRVHASPDMAKTTCILKACGNVVAMEKGGKTELMMTLPEGGFLNKTILLGNVSSW